MYKRPRPDEPLPRRYALVTPAKNEEGYIGATIESVLAQSLLPIRWVIVSDGSTDRTDEIVRSFSGKHAFIRLLRREPNGAAGFASKARAFSMGWRELRCVNADYLGNLDADTAFAPDFFERLLDEFVRNPRLGVAGGWILEERRGRYCPRFGNTLRDVAGAVQLFRRRCLDQIGGFPELRYGGEDAAAQALARMHGWQTLSFPHLEVEHRKGHKPTFAKGSRQQFREGVRDYALGYHPLYLGLKCVRRALARPWLVGGACRMAGFAWAWARRLPRNADERLVAFTRREQIGRIRALWGPS